MQHIYPQMVTKVWYSCFASRRIIADYISVFDKMVKLFCKEEREAFEPSDEIDGPNPFYNMFITLE